MRCGHPCELKCGEPCDNGLEKCMLCKEIRERATEERLKFVDKQLEVMRDQDFFELRAASANELAEAMHLIKEFYAVVGLVAKIRSAQSVDCARLRRRYLFAEQACFAPDDPVKRIIEVAGQEDAHSCAREGFSDSQLMLRRSATPPPPGVEVSDAVVLLCRVQLGRVYNCSQLGRKAKQKPPNEFDSTFDPSEDIHGIFTVTRVLPTLIIEVELSPATDLAFPLAWDRSPLPATGWRALPVPISSDVFSMLSRCLDTNGSWLGSGRDVREAGRYSKLRLVRAWRVENRRLWRRYHNEREGIKQEIQQRGLRLPNPHIRKELTDAVKDLPDPLQKDVNEARLLHGTSPEAALSLLSNGLNERFTSVAMFGFGSYFAEDAGKNDQYCTCDKSAGQAKDLHKHLYGGNRGDHPQKVFYIFLCRVVLGVFNKTDKPYKEAPGVYATKDAKELAIIQNTSPPVHHHALLAELGPTIQRYREFIQFHDARIYPEYLLAYQRC